MSAAWPHIPVLRDEVVAALAPRDGEVFVDCTLGMGGHTEALLQAADCTVIGVDRDPAALQIAQSRLSAFGARFRPVHGSFGDLAEILAEHGAWGVDREGGSGVDGILADLGVSSLQLDTPGRGFSFRAAGPLDMRMDTSAGQRAADLLNHWDESQLGTCIASLGEERHARRVARLIVQGRPWSDTLVLAEAIAAAIPGGRASRIHPATRTFQAIRIAVNDELGQLERLLPVAVEHLLPGGRLAIISFHSLEDRIVKRFCARESGRDAERDPYGNPVGTPRLARLASITPSPDDPNPRSRSARLRTAVRL
jgi:16S rRNA (cytosine1402-N4)-methyltransferase